MTETKIFENQLGNLRTVESIGGEARYLYLRPETTRPGSLPVLVAGGWSEGTQSLQSTAHEIYDDGRPVILLDHARRGGLAKDEADIHPEVDHKAQTLLNIIKELGLAKVDVIAHSEGALNTIYAASRQPESFRNIILVAPAGMVGEDTIPRFITRFIPKIIRSYTKDLRETDPENAKRIANSGPKYIRQNPLKAAREIGALAHTSIDTATPDLREAGLRIGLIQAVADSGFPAKRIERHVRLGENIDTYASIAAKDAGHDDLLIHPERSTRAALEMLAGFEKLDSR